MKFQRKIHLLVCERVKAKSEKNFLYADDIRKRIEELGFTIEDGKDGVKIRKG
jgi:cysteinyl-tRNA synthetase